MDQSRTPIIDALRFFAEKNQGYFNIPGHRGEGGVDARLLTLLGAGAFAADRTETDGLDDLHAAEGVIKEAQDLAADLFGSDHCRFVVNGTTGANEAMILAAVRPGDKILVPRNAHKSVMMGLVMSGAVPVWIMPDQEQNSGLYGAVDPAKVEEMLDHDPDIRAVFLVSPTYYGTCSDLKSVAGIAHAHGISLLVDEAHGAHFAFHEALPASAIHSGADLVAQSTHKTIGSLTQSAMLHICGDLIDLKRVEDALKLVQSTSPSYLLIASLDGQRHLMAEQGHELQERAMKLAGMLRDELRKIPGIKVYHDIGDTRNHDRDNMRNHDRDIIRNNDTDDMRNNDTGDTRYNDADDKQDAGSVRKGEYDPCRVVFSPCAAGLTGIEMQNQLFRYHITTELADPQFLVLVVTHGNTEQEIIELSVAVRQIVQEAAEKTAEEKIQRSEIITGHIPEMILTPREAWFAEKQTVPLQDACGLIAGEAVTPYPPGIPLVYPGERLTEELCKKLEIIRNRQIPVHDAADPALNMIRVIK